MKNIFYSLFLVITSLFLFTCNNGTSPDETTGDINIIWTSQPSPTWDGSLLFLSGNTEKKISDISAMGIVISEIQISGNNVVWCDAIAGGDYEIFFWDGITVTQLTDNDYDDDAPKISGNNVVWQRNYEIYFWDGTNIKQISNNGSNLTVPTPEIAGNNVIWEIMDTVDFSWVIFFWDGTNVKQIPNAGSPAHISGNNVVWCGGGIGSEIFFWNGDNVTQVTDNEYIDNHPQISGNNVVWVRDDEITDCEIFFWDGNTETQVTNNDYDDRREPQICGNNVVWVGDIGTGAEIFFWDGTTVKQLTNGSYNVNPAISIK